MDDGTYSEWQQIEMCTVHIVHVFFLDDGKTVFKYIETCMKFGNWEHPMPLKKYLLTGVSYVCEVNYDIDMAKSLKR